MKSRGTVRNTLAVVGVPVNNGKNIPYSSAEGTNNRVRI